MCFHYMCRVRLWVALACVYLIADIVKYLKYRRLCRVASAPHYQPPRNSSELIAAMRAHKQSYPGFCMNTDSTVERLSEKYGFAFPLSRRDAFFRLFAEIDTNFEADLSDLVEGEFHGTNDETTHTSEGAVTYGKMSIESVYRPVAVDVVIECVRAIGRRIAGGTTHSVPTGEQELTYHLITPAGDTCGVPVVIFFHGVGIGCAAYAPLLRRLGERYTVLAFEIPGIGTHFREAVAGNFTNLAHTVARALRIHKLHERRVVLVGHSLGSAFASAMHNASRSQGDLLRVAGIALLDPVCFMHGIARAKRTMLLTRSEFCRTFERTHAGVLEKWMRRFVISATYYCILRDIGTQYVTKRVLSSATDVLFRDRNVPCLVYVGDRDTLIDGPSVAAFVKHEFPCARLVHTRDHHGTFMHQSAARARVANELERFVESLARQVTSNTYTDPEISVYTEDSPPIL